MRYKNLKLLEDNFKVNAEVIYYDEVLSYYNKIILDSFVFNKRNSACLQMLQKNKILVIISQKALLA